MKSSFSIRAKLFIGIAILIVGYLASVAAGFVTGASRERELEQVGSISVPASLKCQSALFEFEASVKGFNDAIMMGDEETLQAAAEHNAQTVAILDEIGAVADRAGLAISDVSAVRHTLAGLDAQRADVFRSMSSGDGADREATRRKAEKLNTSTGDLRQQIGKLSKAAARELDMRLARNMEQTRNERKVHLAIAALVVLVGGTVVLVVIQRGIVKPIIHVVHGLHETSRRVEVASGSIRESGRALADGASGQAASLEQTSATLEEISSVAKRNAEHSAGAKEKVGTARTAAEQGIVDVGAMRDAMGEIKEASDNIAKIVKAIDEIAFQTNILALNAAVEAARAGEAGMGFAVVAEEVRHLAQRSASAARETAELIDDSIAKSERGVHISAKVASSLEQIGQQIREIDGLMAEIAGASNEQSNGVIEVNRAVIQLNETTQANAASAEESAATVEELSAQAAELHRFTAELTGAVLGRVDVEDRAALADDVAAAHGPVPSRRTAPARMPRRRELEPSRN